MTQSFFGRWYIDPSEIDLRIGNVYILKNGKTLTKDQVIPTYGRCVGCGGILYEQRELRFHNQTDLCFSCVTGNRSDMSVHNSCRMIHPLRLDEAKRLLMRYTGERVEFWRIQEYYGRLTELHFTWYPDDAFMRIGYDCFRLLTTLTRGEAEESVNCFITKGFDAVLELTRGRRCGT